MKNLWQIVQKINMDPGRARIDEPMSAHTTFKIGGPADIYLEISSVKELVSAVGVLRSEGLPYFVLGGGANILVSDKGIRGVVLDLGGLSTISSQGGKFFCGAGLKVDLACEEALARGLGGLENFFGMPGSVGGSIYMNARCYEEDFSSRLRSIEVYDAAEGGRVERIEAAPLRWAYKRSPFQEGGALEGKIILGAEFDLISPGGVDASKIAATMRSRHCDRAAKGHYAFPSAGSMFKNNRRFGKPTGAILDSLGLKGARIGDASISPQHANIFVNLGHAKAEDMAALIDFAKNSAKEAFKFELELEVRLVGDFGRRKV